MHSVRLFLGQSLKYQSLEFNNDILDWNNLLKNHIGFFFQQPSFDKKMRATFKVSFLCVLQCVMRHYWSPLYRALTTNLAGRHCCCQNHGYWTLEMRISLINFREPSCNTLCTATLSLGSRLYSFRILEWPKSNSIMLNHRFFSSSNSNCDYCSLAFMKYQQQVLTKILNNICYNKTHEIVHLI